MSRNNYWVYIVTWLYGWWKTYNSNGLLKINKHVLNITNFSCQGADLQFRSLEDLIQILDAIYRFKLNPENRKHRIHIICDEWALYFDARNFKNFPAKFLPFLVQLRKLNVRFDIIVQNLNMIDVNFRRVCYEVRRYRNFWFFFKSELFTLLDEGWNLDDPLKARLEYTRFHLPPSFKKIWNNIAWPYLEIAHDKISSKFFSYTNENIYDTNEIILPYYNVLDRDKLIKLLPCSYDKFDVEDYKLLINDNENRLQALVTYKKTHYLIEKNHINTK